eukprot:3046601-Pleurochrysis_carterae.AAC.6
MNAIVPHDQKSTMYDLDIGPSTSKDFCFVRRSGRPQLGGRPGERRRLSMDNACLNRKMKHDLRNGCSRFTWGTALLTSFMATGRQEMSAGKRWSVYLKARLAPCPAQAFESRIQR